MAETVYLNDGSMEVVFDEKGIFLERLLREKLGDDAAHFFTNYVSEIKEEAKYTEEAQHVYQGPVFVPDDLEVIHL